jgi:ligand-binding sensor domain-containing protein
VNAASMAQAPYNFYNLSLEKGLSDARVNDIVQDKYGFMWFATANGLNRYDGYSIKTFYENNKETGLPSNNVLALHTTAKGELWIGTQTGCVRYDFIGDRFYHFDTTQKDAAIPCKMSVAAFEEDEQGNIYIGGTAGLFKFQASSGKWENLSRHFKNEMRLRYVRKLKFFKPGLLYAATSNNMPFFEIDLNGNKIDSIYYKTQYADTCCLNMFGLEKLNDEELMVGLLSYGVAKFNTRTRQYSTVGGALGGSDSILYNSVYDILRDHKGRTWVASYYFRLGEYLAGENAIHTVDKDSYNPFGFDGKSASCLYEDRQHNIWVGTISKGVYHFNPDHTTTRFYPQNDFIPGAQQQGRVTCISTIDSNTWLIGSDNGPSFYNTVTGKFNNYKGISITGINKALEHVRCNVTDNEGIVWMGTNRLGLMRYDPVKKVFRCFSRVTYPNQLIDDGITDILTLPDNNLLFIGWGRPNIFNTRDFTTTSLRDKTDNALFALNDITAICKDGRQHIWLASGTAKLYEYDPLNQSLTDQSALLPAPANPLSISRLAWQNNQLYVASNNGILLIEKGRTPRIFPLNLGDHSQDEVRGILPDGEYVWFGNNHLIGRLHPSSGKMTFLGEKDGLSNVQIFSNTLTRSSRGTILAGSNRGFYEIYPDRIEELESPPVYLTGFRVYDKPFNTAEVISATKKINLGYQQNFFSFDMSAFDYAQAADIEFAYILDGFDKDWQYIGKSRTGTYTNVPGGDYTLRLKTRYTTSGKWKISDQQLSIHVGKPVTSSLWFRVLIALLVAALIYLLYRMRVRSISKEARLRSDYEIKLNELENSALRTQMNPHFIFNSLNTINSFINSNDRAQANRYISKFSKLVRLILDHSREKKIVLKDELEVATLYMELEQIRFENKFEFSIEIIDVDATAVEVPPLIIQPFVENSILHGLLPGKKGGSLLVKISKKGSLIECSIEDTGIGRAAARKTKQLPGSNRKSHGMEITLKRIELFNKENGVNDPVEIIDRYTADGEPAGTTVEIKLACVETF